MISTRGRYALRVMIDLAEKPGVFTPMKEVAQREGISLKYLEQILPVLTKNGLVEAASGKGGGYRLTRAPGDYTVGEILKLTEGTLAPVACLAQDTMSCERADACKTLRFWKGLDEAVSSYVDSVRLSDFL